MHFYFKQLVFAVSTLGLIGCGGGSSSGGTIDNTAPTFTSPAQVEVKENSTNITTIRANDTTSVNYSIVSGNDSAKFSIDVTSGLLRFKSAPDFESPSDANRDNSYEVTIAANDAFRNEARQNLTVNVTDVNETVIVQDINITDDIQVKSLGTGRRVRANVTMQNGAKSLYVLLTNKNGTSSESSEVSVTPKVVAPYTTNNKIAALSLEQHHGHHAPLSIMQYNMDTSRFVKHVGQREAKQISIQEPNKKDIEGSSKTFYLNQNKNTQTTATARKVVSDIQTKFGLKTLNIWVSDDSFDSGNGCSKDKCVTQTMVDALADTFLKTGDDNDVYDWVTNIYGEEWDVNASNKYSNLISADNEITILLTDIDNDNSPSGGVIGFFHSKDNEKPTSQSGSNGRIMFYADAVIFANGEGAWSIDDYWPKEMVSTLAHEFQHMIHFYQKTVLLVLQNSSSADAWLNEMLSEATEDLIATKIKHTGPRGVNYLIGSAGDSGNMESTRYGLFNANNTRSLTTWQNSLKDYAQVNAFGTFLTRNYGGAKVLHDIVHNGKVHEDAVVEATGKSFGDLVKEWGVAVLLSDKENPVDLPTYNTGDFTDDTFGSVTYELGSINFFNYIPTPTLHTLNGTADVKPHGNYYYKVGDNLNGTVTIELNLGSTTEATLIAK